MILHGIKSQGCNNVQVFRLCDVNYSNVIYQSQVSSFDLAPTFMNFMSQSSNFIDLRIIYNAGLKKLFVCRHPTDPTLELPNQNV